MRTTKGQLLQAHYIFIALFLILLFLVPGSIFKWFLILAIAVTDGLLTNIMNNRFKDSWYDEPETVVII
jgi:hypothetical protein